MTLRSLYEAATEGEWGDVSGESAPLSLIGDVTEGIVVCKCWTQEDHRHIVALHNCLPELLAVRDAAEKLFEQQAIGNGGCYLPITDCDGPCEHFAICALRPIRAALAALREKEADTGKEKG